MNPDYVLQVSQTGAQIKGRSRWRNSVLVFVSDTSQLIAISQLPFVIHSTALNRTQTASDSSKFGREQPYVVASPKNLGQTSPINYGAGTAQINQIGGEGLHLQGFRGQGMVIAVLDAGFPGVDTLHAFDSLRLQNRLLGTWDFQGGNTDVFGFNSHGTNTLSCMASCSPGFMVGTAPMASYYLLRTEVAETENPSEEYYWVEGAEYADSAGADVISSSLGYSTFDRGWQSYNTQQMDGNTAICTQGADIAALKGLLVVSSAGNLGGSSWNIISAPADGDHVFSIGAVDGNNQIAGFSSRGPTADLRIKPDVCAMGVGAGIVTPNGFTSFANGTSFSCPIIAGMSACLWQALPNLSSLQLMTLIRQTASMAGMPNTTYGWGIPNYSYALSGLTELAKSQAGEEPLLFPNPVVNESLQLLQFAHDSQTIRLSTYDLQGKLVLEQSSYVPANNYQSIPVEGFSSLSRGLYLVRVQNRSGSYSLRVTRQ